MEINKKRGSACYYYVDEACRKGNLYKYMTMETALTCIDTGSLRFVEPSKWPDKFEGLYYKSSYARVDPGDRVPKKLVACCLAINKACEAAWNQYTYGGSGLSSVCVQFVIDRQKLQEQLDTYANGIDAKVYEGVVDYSHNEFVIQNIKRVASPLHSAYFDDFSLAKYLNLLLLKRPAFQYESEVRFFIIKNDQNTHVDTIDVPIDWRLVIKRILISSKCSKWEEKLFTDYVNTKIPGVTIQKCNILDAPNGFDYEIEG